MDSHRERELKFDVDDQFAVPDLDELAGRSTRIERHTLRMASTYYDTEERALLAAGLTLRHRAGDADTGWQLKVPTRSARTEITVPLQAGADVPDRFRGLLVGAVRGRPLRPVALIRTERVQHRLLEDERVLLEIADDRVQGTALGDRASITAWREVEAELGRAGDERLLLQAASVLRAAGATPSEAGSKLAKTLGVPPPPIPSDAPAAVGDYARRQWQAIVAGDIALRRGFDKVHKTRVAVRRFRSMLRVLRPLLDREHTRSLDAELSWFQHLLGDVRDLQVQRARFADRLAALPPENVLGPVAGYLEQSLLAEQVQRREELTRALDSPRYLAMLDQAADWVADPPLPAGLGAADLQRVAHRATRKARRRLAAALQTDDPTLLHGARKAAKRARYASEIVAPLRGKNSKRPIKRLTHVQDVLGEHQDSLVARDLLRRLGTRAATMDGQNGFTLGLLFALEQAATRDARARAGHLKI